MDKFHINLLLFKILSKTVLRIYAHHIIEPKVLGFGEAPNSDPKRLYTP